MPATPSSSGTTGAGWSAGPWRRYEPKAVRRLVAVVRSSSAAPRVASLLRRPDLTRQLWSMQTPWLPERAWSGAELEPGRRACCTQWAAPGWPDLPTSLTYRQAFALRQHRLLRC